MVKKGILLCVGVYVSVMVFMTVTQRDFVFKPTQIQQYDLEVLSNRHIQVIHDQAIEWLFVKSPRSTGRVLVHFHGNSGTALSRVEKIQPWIQNGFDVVLGEYPGYGTNGGAPSEQSFYDAARVVMERTLTDHPNAEIYLYGESIGSGVATQMAVEYDEKALIIEGGFTSLVDIAWSRYPILPVPLLLWDRFDNLVKINQIGSPLLMIHGRQDRTVPYDYGQRLYTHYKGDKRLISLDDAGHNDKYDYLNFSDVMSFL